MSQSIEFPPVRNGLDYLESAIKHLRGHPSARDLKYAVLHLQAAVEVLLKVRLIREHWALVFRYPDKASRGAFSSGGQAQAVEACASTSSVNSSEGFFQL